MLIHWLSICQNGFNKLRVFFISKPLSNQENQYYLIKESDDKDKEESENEEVQDLHISDVEEEKD